MDDYYVEQAGSGISYYSGARYQKGHNWFGRLFRGGILPLIKYIGRKALTTGSNVVQDVISGENLKDSAKKHIKDTIHDVTDDIVEKVAQKGSGVITKVRAITTKRKKIGRPRKRGRPSKRTKKSREKKDIPDWLK